MMISAAVAARRSGSRRADSAGFGPKSQSWGQDRTGRGSRASRSRRLPASRGLRRGSRPAQGVPPVLLGELGERPPVALDDLVDPTARLTPRPRVPPLSVLVSRLAARRRCVPRGHRVLLHRDICDVAVVVTCHVRISTWRPRASRAAQRALYGLDRRAQPGLADRGQPETTYRGIARARGGCCGCRHRLTCGLRRRLQRGTTRKRKRRRAMVHRTPRQPSCTSVLPRSATPPPPASAGTLATARQRKTCMMNT